LSIQEADEMIVSELNNDFTMNFIYICS